MNPIPTQTTTTPSMVTFDDLFPLTTTTIDRRPARRRKISRRVAVGVAVLGIAAVGYAIQSRRVLATIDTENANPPVR